MLMKERRAYTIQILNMLEDFDLESRGRHADGHRRRPGAERHVVLYGSA
jgi:hypothetical protein